MIAITFALANESSGFVRLLGKSGRPDCEGELHGQAIAVVHTGVGAVIARPRIRRFLAGRSDVRCLISAGFAGAVSNELQVGDLFVATNFSDITPSGSALPRYQTGTLASTDRVLDTADERRRFAAQSGAAAVDMETRSIAEECRAAGIPMLSLRVISDTPAQPFPAPPEVLFDIAAQRTNAARLGIYLATHPLAIARLAKFAQRISGARGKLTAALDSLLQTSLI